MVEYINWNKKVEEISKIVKESFSYSEVLKKLGRKPVGGSISNVRRFCLKHNIDISHMTGQGHLKGKRPSNFKTADEILVIQEDKLVRPKSRQLKRALLEKNIPYKCNICGISSWQGQEITLEIDHINSCYWDNRLENLQFLCPNCHSIKTKKDFKIKKDIVPVVK